MAELSNFTINTQLSSTAAALFATPITGQVKLVNQLVFRNTSASSRTITVYMVQSGGSAATTNELASRAIPPGREWMCIEAQAATLNEGQTLQAKQNTGTDVNVNCSGVIA